MFEKVSYIMLNISMIITNNYLKVVLLSYFEIAITFTGFVMFSYVGGSNRRLLIVVIIGVEILFGFVVFPYSYQGFLSSDSPYVYYYLFPVLTWILQLMINSLFYVIGWSNNSFFQVSFFISGLYYGTLLTLTTSQI